MHEFVPQQEHAVLCSQIIPIMLNANVYDSMTSKGLQTYMHGSHLGIERRETTDGYINERGLVACMLVM